MDAVLKLNKLDFIKAQLATYGGEKKEYAERTLIRCPFHNDTNPSGSLSLNSTYAGYFRCYSCGTRANWDELAEKLGLQPFKRSEPKEEYAVDLMARAEAFLEQKKLYREDKFKFWSIPPNKRWRSIPTNLLIELGGRMCYKWSDDYQRWGSTKFIYLPVNINEEQVGFFRARLKKEGDQPSYFNAAGHWSRTHGLFPFDHSVQLMQNLNSSTMVLVEGQRDCLRLISQGIPAMCIFGTQSFSDHKAKLLELAGVKHLLVMMDSDEAGMKGTEKVKEACTGMFKLTILKLWSMKNSPYLQFVDHENPTKAAKEAGVELWDPLSCPQWILDKIKRKYF